MEKKVKQKLIEFGLKKGDHLGVAVSGGVDSMVLLNCLCKLAPEMNIIIEAYHFEHGIRGAHSVRDMDFVQKECRKRGIACVTKRADVPAVAKDTGVSLETAARAARYAFLDEQDADYIATAHHMDDMAETVLMNLVRGSGLAGLGGIPESRGRYVRPLLGISRKEIEAYADQNGIAYVHDATNDDMAYTRNLIRKEVMPLLRRINTGAGANIARSAALLREDEHALMQAAKDVDCIDVEDGGIYIDIATLERQAAAVQTRIIRLAVLQKYDLKDIEQVHVENALKLAEGSETAKRIDIGHGIYAAVVYGKLMIGKKKVKRYNNTSMAFCGQGKYVFKDIAFVCSEYDGQPRFAPGVVYLDADAVKGASFRCRRQGDRITPLGMKGTKRLSDYLSDKKVPLHLRDDVVLLAKDQDVFWVVGVGESERSKVKKDSLIYKIEYGESGHAE